MKRTKLVVVCDRGGHLHNARLLVGGLNEKPDACLTTYGPDFVELRKEFRRVYRIPYLFSWWGKHRFLNPFKGLYHGFLTLLYAAWLRPKVVVSLGALDAVPFCYWARLFGATVYHVECMNQVVTASWAGRVLYPICESIYVQWPELLAQYGRKARYDGWVL